MAYTTIDKGSKYFNTVLYTGDGTGAKAITGVGFQPDLVWLKTRSTAFHHQLHDRVRGATAGAIYSSLTNAQDSNYPITSFDSDGFTLGNSASLIADSFGSQNFSGTTMCSWNWLASNTSGSSNTSGTITSTVSANTTSGFSVGKTTGTLSSGDITVGHGLGVAPSMIFWKRTDGVSNWQVFHKSTGTGLLQLNQTSAVNTSSAFWGTMSSTTFTVSNSLYGSGETYVFYAFAEVKGYSKAFSYTGNGSSDGVFTYCGFKPAFLLVKSTGADNWCMLDNKRDTFNVMDKRLFPHLSNAESTGVPTVVDFVSNGFKLRTSDSSFNLNGQSFIGFAFAENPFVSSKGIPTTAR